MPHDIEVPVYYPPSSLDDILSDSEEKDRLPYHEKKKNLTLMFLLIRDPNYYLIASLREVVRALLLVDILNPLTLESSFLCHSLVSI